MSGTNPWAELRAALAERLRGQVPELAESCAAWNGEEEERLFQLARLRGAAAWVRLHAARAIPGAPRAEDAVAVEVEVLAVAASQRHRAVAAADAEALAWRIRAALETHRPVSRASGGCTFAAQTMRSTSPSAHAVQLTFHLVLHLAQRATT
ncbi:MAG: hypothetical protein RBU25_06310 [Lentisphaeria bacterium]|jgi:hypothetical protein|nr:hypothetical protein [Lentisphaeria bacterium]